MPQLSILKYNAVRRRDLSIYMNKSKSRRQEPDTRHADRCIKAGYVKTLRQPAMAFVEISASEGLRHSRIQAKQHANPEQRRGVVAGIGQADRANRKPDRDGRP